MTDWQEWGNDLLDKLPAIRDYVMEHIQVAFLVASILAFLFLALWVRAALELRRLRRDFTGIRRVSTRMGGAWLR